MKHRVGNLEIDHPGPGEWARLTMHYNEDVSASIDLRSEQDFRDLQYLADNLVRRMPTAPILKALRDE